MAIPRLIKTKLVSLTSQFRVITITGPRQSGKTTLCKEIFKEKTYLSLENPDLRNQAETDPISFLARAGKNGAVIDEIQRVPELLSYIQGIVDEDQIPGQFILTGSAQLLMLEKVTQTLAGRTAILNLLPFSIKEILENQLDEEVSRDQELWMGHYPDVRANRISPLDFYPNYIETYVERDVRQLINIKDIRAFRNLIRLCAGRVGSILDYSDLANSIGVSQPTVRSWISILEASYVLFLLPPYYKNFGKRLIKSPKLFFYDTGMACSLLGIQSPEQIELHPARGGLFENLVILEVMKSHTNKGLRPELYYYRDSNQNEIDLLIPRAEKLEAIEIKSTQTFNSALLKPLKNFEKVVGDLLTDPKIVYAGKDQFSTQGVSLRRFDSLD